MKVRANFWPERETQGERKREREEKKRRERSQKGENIILQSPFLVSRRTALRR